MSVVSGSVSQSDEVTSPISSPASSAGEPARAAASAACTIAATCSGVAALPDTEPVAVPPSTAAKLTTVTETSVITPLVVNVLLAHRRFALVMSRTIAMQSSAVEVASACSTSCWAVVVPRREMVISGPPRRWC